MTVLFRLLRLMPKLLRIISNTRFLHRVISNHMINRFGYSTQARPKPYSLASKYTTWDSLTNKTFTGRHLPEAEHEELPPAEVISELWRRKSGEEILSEDSSMLFSFFAQWFVDSFLRTDLFDPNKNTSNHEIDFCQLYGLSKEKTDALRLKQGGKMKYQEIDGEVYPPYLFDVEKTTSDNWVFASEEFEQLHGHPQLRAIFHGVPEDRLKRMFAVGLEHGNSSVGYTAICIIMLREHNRVCDELALEYPSWDDDRLFETTRNIMIVMLIRIVSRDYIGHISSIPFPLEASVGMAEKQAWYRSNWISIEFSLLYRWHSMVPDHFFIDDNPYESDEYRSNTPLVMDYGVEKIITSATVQKTGRIGLGNTPDMFFDPLPIPNDDRSVMQRMVDRSREAKLASYNEYRKAFSLNPISSFEELSDDPALCEELKTLYKNNIDDVEWLVGIFAEKHEDGGMLGELMTQMVAYDAFTHALTNPLLSKNIFHSGTFSEKGMSIIENTETLSAIIRRNVTHKEEVIANFTTPINPPGSYGLPVIGVVFDTLDFMLFSGWKKFFTKRRDQYSSSVFKVNLFMKTVVILDHHGFEPLFNWDDRLKKDYGFGWAIPPKALVGGIVPSVFKANPEHEKYKSFYIRLLKDQAGSFENVFNDVFAEFSAKWRQSGEFSFAEELERLSARFVFEWYFNSSPNVDDVRYVYSNIFGHKPLALLKLLPWSSYNKSIPLFERLLAVVKASSRFEHMLELAGEEELYNEDEIAKQLLFLTGMNNFLGLQGMSKALIGELSLRPELRQALREEITLAESKKENDSTEQRLSLMELGKLETLDHTLQEVMRLHPPVFFIYGRAQKDFSLRAKTGIYAIKKDEHLMGVIPLAHLDADIYDDPESFKPERFKDPKASEKLLWPHGQHTSNVSANNHICPGKNVAMEFARILCYSLLKEYDWELQEKPVWSDKKYALNVASPVGPMTVSSFSARGEK